MPGDNGESLAPLLIGVDRVAELCGISARTVWKMAAMDAMPKPVAIGHRRLWRYQEIAAWVQGGCLAVQGAAK